VQPEYDALYAQQNQELDHGQARRARAPDGDTLFYTTRAPTWCCSTTPTLQAYRTDRFEGWLQQPKADGPDVIFSNSSPTYFNLRLIGSGGGSGRRRSLGDGSTGFVGDHRHRRPVLSWSWPAWCC
jgi:hypothetical protein